MAPILLQRMTETTTSFQVYPSAIIIAIASLLVVFAIVPPMCWHFRNHNIGATALVAWIILLLLLSFVNAILWPTDDITHWYDGAGLCDVEVKLQIASQSALPAAFACILRALAAIMDIDHATISQTKAEKRKNTMIDLVCCVGCPALQMLMHYIVQPNRYYLFGISGCVPSAGYSWLAVVLVLVPPAIWVLVDTYYAVLILIRLHRYQLSFSSILAHSNTSKSRFMRLYLICILWIFGSVPVEIYIFYENLSTRREAFTWSETHDSPAWNEILMFPSNGKLVYDRWIWLVSGIVVFGFFGVGKEAVNMYRSGLRAMGLEKIFPCLRSDRTYFPTSRMFDSLSSRAKSLFHHTSFLSTRTSHGSSSLTSSPEIHAKKSMTIFSMSSKTSDSDKNTLSISTTASADCRPCDPETSHSGQHPSVFTRISSIFKLFNVRKPLSTDSLAVTALTIPNDTVCLAELGSQPSPPSFAHASTTSSYEVLGQGGSRQGSDTVGALPAIVCERV